MASDLEHKAYEYLTAECDTDRGMVEIDCAIAAIVAALRAAPAAAGVPDARPVITLSGYSLLQALDYIAPERAPDQLETLASIQWGDARTTDDGIDPAGYYCWITDYPEEGSIPLADEPATPGQVTPAEQQGALPVQVALAIATAWRREASAVIPGRKTLIRCAAELEAAVAARPPAGQAVPEDVRRDALHNPLTALIKAGEYLQPRILSTNGADCMDRFEFALDAAKAALSAQPQGEEASRG